MLPLASDVSVEKFLHLTSTLKKHILAGVVKTVDTAEASDRSFNRTVGTPETTRYISIHTRTRVGTLIVATIYLQLIQNRYMFRSFTVLQCSHQHCVQPVASDVEVVGYL